MGIIGSVGSTTFVDVNSSTGSDNISTGDDTLATRAFNLGYNQDNDQWTRLYSVSYNSGDHARAPLPTSGFALFGVSNIVGTLGDVAEVWSADDDNMFDTDNVLQVGARLYGFRPQGTSGVWPRIRSTVSGALYTTMGSLSGRFPTVFITDRDGLDVNDEALFTAARMHGFHGPTSGWSRLRLAALDRGMAQESGFVLPISGYALWVATVTSDMDGNIANVTPTVNGGAQVNSGLGALNTLSKLYGFAPNDLNWQAFENYSRAFDDGSPDDRTLMTTASMVGYHFGNGSWSRVGVKANDISAGYSLQVSETPTAGNIDTSRQTITNLSGGTVLNSFSIAGKLIIQNESGNNTMNVAGNNAGDFPHATQGISLFAGETLELLVRNADVVAVWAATSGQRIRVLGTN